MVSRLAHTLLHVNLGEGLTDEGSVVSTFPVISEPRVLILIIKKRDLLVGRRKTANIKTRKNTQ